MASIVSLVVVAYAVAAPDEVPIFRVPVVTAFTMNDVTELSSASFPAVVRSAKEIAFSVSSVADVMLDIVVRVGATLAASSFVIVPVAVVVDIVALVALDRVTVYVSLLSTVASPFIDTLNVFVVSPGANVSVPLAAV